MNTWVGLWEGALQDRVQEDTPYDLSTYDAYLRWYAPQTRTRLVLAADEPAPSAAIVSGKCSRKSMQ